MGVGLQRRMKGFEELGEMLGVRDGLIKDENRSRRRVRTQRNRSQGARAEQTRDRYCRYVQQTTHAKASLLSSVNETPEGAGLVPGEATDRQDIGVEGALTSMAV